MWLIHEVQPFNVHSIYCFIVSEEGHIFREWKLHLQTARFLSMIGIFQRETKRNHYLYCSYNFVIVLLKLWGILILTTILTHSEMFFSLPAVVLKAETLTRSIVCLQIPPLPSSGFYRHISQQSAHKTINATTRISQTYSPELGWVKHSRAPHAAARLDERVCEVLGRTVVAAES